MPSACGPQVSVVLPICGNHRATQTLPAVCGAWLAQDVPCEVVVAGATDAIAATLRSLAPSVVCMLPADRTTRSLGLLRSLGASAARAPTLYLGDADIVPLGRDFLSRALNLCGRGIVVQPWMYRLVDVADGAALSAWDRPRDDCFCMVTRDNTGRLAPMPGEQVTWRGGIPLVVPPPAAIDPEDSPSLVPRVPFHWGGVLVRKQLFEHVGGYCRRYTGWGAEDEDLLFKLAHRASIVTAWRVARDLVCLHFEHPRPYAGPELAANRTLLARRVYEGGEAMIREDCGAAR